jgi:hypothetical protein
MKNVAPKGTDYKRPNSMITGGVDGKDQSLHSLMNISRNHDKLSQEAGHEEMSLQPVEIHHGGNVLCHPATVKIYPSLSALYYLVRLKLSHELHLKRLQIFFEGKIPRHRIRLLYLFLYQSRYLPLFLPLYLFLSQSCYLLHGLRL